MTTKHNKKQVSNSIIAKPITFIICACVLVIVTIASSITSLVLSQNNKDTKGDDAVDVEQQEELQPTIEQVKADDMSGIYGNFTSKIDVTKISPVVASDPSSIEYINQYNQSNEPLSLNYFGLVRNGKIVEQISILTPCYSVDGYTIDNKGVLKRSDGTSTKTNAAKSSTNEYAKYGAFVCQSNIVELPINLPNGAKVRPDLGSSYNGKIDEENGKLYLDITWSILADGTDVYYSSSDYDGYQWTVQNADNETIRTYLVKLVPMLSDGQLEFLNTWKSRIDANKEQDVQWLATGGITRWDE